MSKTKQAGYTCYTCSKAITFHYGSRVRYNLDGTIHLCRPDDSIAYEEYCEYVKHDKHARWIGWRLTGEDFWKWKWEVYDVHPQVQPGDDEYKTQFEDLVDFR